MLISVPLARRVGFHPARPLHVVCMYARERVRMGVLYMGVLYCADNMMCFIVDYYC